MILVGGFKSVKLAKKGKKKPLRPQANLWPKTFRLAYMLSTPLFSYPYYLSPFHNFFEPHLYNMPRKRVAVMAKMCTGGRAKRVDLKLPLSLPALDPQPPRLHPANSHANIQVSNHCVVENLWDRMAIIYYSIVPFAKMGANFRFVQRRTASMQTALNASKSQKMNTLCSIMIWFILHACHAIGKSAAMRHLFIMWVFLFVFAYFFIAKMYCRVSRSMARQFSVHSSRWRGLLRMQQEQPHIPPLWLLFISISNLSPISHILQSLRTTSPNTIKRKVAGLTSWNYHSTLQQMKI